MTRGNPRTTPDPGDRSSPARSSSPEACVDWNTVACGLLEDYLGIHHKAVEEIKNQVNDPMKQVEALSKLSQALDRTFRSLYKASPDHAPLTVAREVLALQVTFVKERFPNHAPALLEILAPFGRELAKNFGKSS